MYAVIRLANAHSEAKRKRLHQNHKGSKAYLLVSPALLRVVKHVPDLFECRVRLHMR